MSNGTVNIWASGTGQVGVCDSIEYIDATTGLPVKATYCPANSNLLARNSEVYAYIWEDPDMRYEVQADGGGSVAIDGAAVGATAGYIPSTPVTTGGGHSQGTLDASDLATGTATAALKVLELSSPLENVYSATAALSMYGRLVVQLHQNFWVPGAAATSLNPGV
jgi:hypothetical protein